MTFLIVVDVIDYRVIDHKNYDKIELIFDINNKIKDERMFYKYIRNYLDDYISNKYHTENFKYVISNIINLTELIK